MAGGQVITPEEAIRLTVLENYGAISNMDDDGLKKVVLIYKSYDELKGHFPDESINQLKKMDIAFGNKTPIQTIQKNWVGQKIPGYSFVASNGLELNSDSLKGKVVVLNFWFTTCRGCLIEIPDLNTLVRHFSKTNDVVFIAPALNDSFTIKSFLKEKSFLYECVEGADFINVLGISGFPTHFVIDKHGIVSWVHIGSSKEIIHQLNKEINLALSQKTEP